MRFLTIAILSISLASGSVLDSTAAKAPAAAATDKVEKTGPKAEAPATAKASKKRRLLAKIGAFGGGMLLDDPYQEVRTKKSLK